MSSVENAEFDAFRGEMTGFQERTGVSFVRIDATVGRIGATLGRVVATVARHEENLARIEDNMATKVDVAKLLDRFDVLMNEVLASRGDRLLRDKGFSEQQAALIDHEMRLTRLERDRKLS